MKQTARYITFILLFLISGLTLNPGTAYAQKTEGTVEVDMGIMDDFGNILADYIKERFQIKDDYFIYREPPVIDRYTFATANVLKLETEKGVTYRVNYFYTLDSTEPGQIPEPLPMSEMPMKKAPIERVKTQVSWTDDAMRELADTEVMSLNHFWDAFDIPVPRHLNGYGFLRLETGTTAANGETLPQFVYVYKRGETDDTAASLIFGHLVGEDPIKTIRPEYTPPEPATSPGTKPATAPRTTPGSKPGTTPGTTPGTKPASNPGTIPVTKPVSTSPSKTGPEVKTTTPRTDPALTTPEAFVGTGSVTTGTRADAGQNGTTDNKRNTAIFLFILLGSAGLVIFLKIRK